MGVIRRQGIKQSLVNYFAVGIAALSTLFVYPIDTDLYGFARFIIDSSFFIAPLILLGSDSVATKYFPSFQNEQKLSETFPGMLLSFAFIGSCLALGILFLFKNQIYLSFEHHSEVYKSEIYKVAFISVLIAFFTILYRYTSNFKRIVIPSIFQNFIKLSLPILILLIVFYDKPIYFLTNGILLTYLIALICSILYLKYLSKSKIKFQFSKISKDKFKEIFSFATFSLFTGIGGMMAFKIDSIMVSTLLNFESNGVYTIASFIGNAIAIPTNAIIQIAAPILATSFAVGNLKEVNKLYKKSSINLLITGLLLYLLIFISIEDLFDLMPKKISDIKIAIYIVLIIGATKIVDMATSVNTQIINYSKYYRFNLFAILLLAVLNIGLNLILIPKYNMIGAALATFFSLFLFNLAKLFFIYRKFQMQPFTKESIIAILLTAFTFGASQVIPEFSSSILNIILNSTVVILVYTSLVLYFKLSPEMNDLYTTGKEKIAFFVK